MDHRESEPPMAEGAGAAPSEREDRVRATRRNLLKAGAIGVPLVLTFRSTSAWAVSAGCRVEPGTLEIPGNIVRVDQDGNPIPAQNPTPQQPYETIFVTQDPFGTDTDRLVDATVDLDRLRALVYNQNIGASCVASIDAALITRFFAR